MLHAKRLVSSNAGLGLRGNRFSSDPKPYGADEVRFDAGTRNLLHDLGSRREELGETISSMDRIPGNALLIIL